MPGFNQKGPMGQGPMTGRRMGRCTDFGESLKGQISTKAEVETKDSGLVNQAGFPGRGLGFGRGRGRGGTGRGMGRQNRFRGSF